MYIRKQLTIELCFISFFFHPGGPFPAESPGEEATLGLLPAWLSVQCYRKVQNSLHHSKNLL